MKILITVNKSYVSPRFDYTIEALIASCDNNDIHTPYRTILLPRPSAEELCSYIIKENIDTVICGGIEDKFLKYLTWKKIHVIHSVIGPYNEAIKIAAEDNLRSGTILPGANSL